jgi:hypothetical protein
MNDHDITVEYTIDDDGIWLFCTCGAQIYAGFEPSVHLLVEAADLHLQAFAPVPQ